MSNIYSKSEPSTKYFLYHSYVKDTLLYLLFQVWVQNEWLGDFFSLVFCKKSNHPWYNKSKSSVHYVNFPYNTKYTDF